ncbi:hypothetical protein TcYC6_0078460 [Trypanosoma cruzi]|nr:hypothetical protein TcYC6_0078460 [Trypanosoma cruzi]
MWRVFAAPSFGILVARRVRDGFRLLHCMGCYKAIHCATRWKYLTSLRCLGGRGGDPPARLTVDGFRRPFEPAVSLLYVHGLTADIAEYIQVAAVLHAFKVLSSAPSTSAVD